MNYWMCKACNSVFEFETPPEVCPDCQEKCTFADVTCYIPECGGPGKFDRKLVAQRAKESEKKMK